MPKVSSDPAMYVELAKAIAAASKSLPFLKDKGPAQPVCREQVMGEAQLLESNALNYLGKCAEARSVAQTARVSFVEAGEDSFALALADYFEGSAASFEGDWTGGWRLLRKALAEFQLYGQENWAGRTEAALGTLLGNRDRNQSALHFFDSALQNLHPTLDEVTYGVVLSNRAFSLMLLGRLDAAKATYAKALTFARRRDSKIGLLTIRYGLASIELKKGQVFRALHSFERIAGDAKAEGFPQRELSAELRAAECIGRLGKPEEMLTRVRALRRMADGVSLECDPPLLELFAKADAADLSSELVAHVVEYLEARDRGVQKGYKPFRLVVNGN
jgi:tetratricopeptide (TPR) repeat protein